MKIRILFLEKEFILIQRNKFNRNNIVQVFGDIITGLRSAQDVPSYHSLCYVALDRQTD